MPVPSAYVERRNHRQGRSRMPEEYAVAFQICIAIVLTNAYNKDIRNHSRRESSLCLQNQQIYTRESNRM